MKYLQLLYLTLFMGCTKPALEIVLPPVELFATSAVAQSPVRSSDFEIEPVNSGLQLLEGSMSYSVTRSDSVKRSGTYAARFELRRTDPEVTYGNKRAEITVINNTTSPNNAVRWYRFSTFIPSAGWETDTKEEVMGAQWHDKSSSCSASPPLSIEVLGNAWRIRTRYSTSNYCTTPSSKVERTPVSAGNIRFDQWDDWIVEYNPRSDDQGFVRIYRNDSLIYSLENAPTNYIGSQIPYMKMGVYKWVWNQTSYGGSVATKRVLFMDALAVYDSSAAYSDVDITPAGSPNQEPLVNAGDDRQVSVSAVSLTGSATDPDGTIAGLAWTQVSGPNTASLSGTTTSALSVSGMTYGTYVFRLTATDNSAATGFDEVSVTFKKRFTRIPKGRKIRQG